MPFPLWTYTSLKFKVNDIGISSDKYLINHIEQRLKDIGLYIHTKRKNKLIYYNGAYFRWIRRRDFIDNGMITVELKNDRLIIRFRSLTAGRFIGCLLFSSLFLIDGNWKISLMSFFGVFSLIYIVRFYTYLNLKDEIKDLVLNL